MSSLIVYCLLLFAIPAVRTEEEYTVSIVDMKGPTTAILCQNVSLTCQILPDNSIVSWMYNGSSLNSTRIRVNQTVLSGTLFSSLRISCVKLEDIGNYTCHAYLPENKEILTTRTHFLNVVLPGEVYESQIVRKELGKDASLVCKLRSYPLEKVTWSILKSDLVELLPENIETTTVNKTHAITKLNFVNLNHHDNGSYVCGAVGPDGPFNQTVHVFVLSKPQVRIDLVKAVGVRMLYVNWTINDGNSPILEYWIQTMKNGSLEWRYYQDKITGGNSSCLLKNLDVNTSYKLRLTAKNKIGTSETDEYSNWVSTLEKEPNFIPDVELKGTTFDSLTIGWAAPPNDLKEYIQMYRLVLTSDDMTKREAIQPVSDRNNVFLFTNLNAATNYTFKMSACSEYTKLCGTFSREGRGTTMDGISDKPLNVTMKCIFDDVSSTAFVYVAWLPPAISHGTILSYQVTLEGEANYRDERGVITSGTYGPKIKSVGEKAVDARFPSVLPNTNYTVKVSAVTRSRKPGREASGGCFMPPTTPLIEKLRLNWNKTEINGRWVFKLNIPRISERNGTICCYIVCLVKLGRGKKITELPTPDDMVLSNYSEVHNNLAGGAYIAETFDSQSLGTEILLGNGQTHSFTESPCRPCYSAPKQKKITVDDLALSNIPGLKMPPTTTENYETSTESEPEVDTPIARRLKMFRNLDDEDVVVRRSAFFQEVTTMASRSDYSAYDGELNTNSNYTGFVHIIVFGKNGDLKHSYSNYFTIMFPGPFVLVGSSGNLAQLTLALYILVALFVIVLVLMIMLFVLHNYTKNVAEEQGIEMTFTNTLMHLCRNVAGRHVPVSSSPPDMPPVAKEELVAAVSERHRDSDYGFQREFEMLPDRFHDRSTRGSEARENTYKNRYPDIKAYDQTRVRLAMIDGVAGSDYINANFVVGYKERKKFICAQGPMDNTVNEFWRMIWEQHLEMVLMLTNLEEYSKTKCAKYWPDANAGEKRFGEFVVVHVQEKKYSDYIVRELKVKMSMDGNEKDKSEERSIIQYHYLVWKDFQAPDHPSGILKFIKRVNEDYSLEKGPILVHCSAGVGRTGTLVALDSLVQQLAEESQVAIFNTVCDLRHQRNFLVQSLKQYIFVYKCLVEVSQSGDTELKVSSLKSTVEKLRKKENGKDRSPLEEEFDKLELTVDERGKTWSVGSNEENKMKNKTTEVIPYDRNRVMLSPIPGKEHSTYINASFIEGYDNTESFIIAQDPLSVTLSDFWRLISEQCVNTLVMMSDLGDGPKKCIRYWPEPDDECTYDNIKVKYIQSESCPYYTRREFCVTNMKSDDSIITTQFQYNGWPTVDGEVPEVTRGLIELVDQTQENHTLAISECSPGPIAVHCNWGADRSSIFVALSILIHQLKNERSVDIYSVVRKLRSQRQLMVKTYAQYEFLHRAVVNYADLHHMFENGATSPI